MTDTAEPTLVQFRFSNCNGATSLQLGARQRKMLDKGTCQVSLSPGSSVSFRTVRSVAASKQLVPGRRIVASPFASLSLAAISAAPAKSMASTVPPQLQTATNQRVPKEPLEILKFAGAKALSGGVPGMVAMALQVVSLMWLRTTMNYQYRYGTSTMVALQTLYREGGVARFYQGLAPALIQGPLSRFGDTAANTGTIALLEDVDIPVFAKTIAASAAAAVFRIFLMPVDAVKTIMQVEGAKGFPSLVKKIQVGGPTVLYHGAVAASLATFVGHYPWFAMYNWLNGSLPNSNELPKRLLRSAFIGFCSSFVSDVCSNSIRVIKTSKQAATVPMSYPQVIKMVVDKDGISGLFGRGLGTKLISNGIQGIMFSVLWRLGQDYYAKEASDKEAAQAIAAADADATATADSASRKGRK